MKKHYKLVILDCILVIGCLYLAMLLRFDFKIQADYIHFLKFSILPLLITFLITGKLFNLYENVWKYASIREFAKIIYTVALTSIIFMIFSYINNFYLVGSDILQFKYYRFPYSVIIISGCLTIGAITGIRIFMKNKNTVKTLGDQGRKLLIIGAGDAGVMIKREIEGHTDLNYKVLGFIDDDSSKKDMMISGVKVLGDRTKIKEVCTSEEVEEILVALPSIEKKQKSEILKICKETGCKLKIIPGIFEIINGDVNISHIRDVKLEDILGREEVDLDNHKIDNYISGKIVMVTGGGGSIGSELCRQLAKFKPLKLLILDFYENSSYYLKRELERTNPELEVEIIIASIRDLPRINNIYARYKPEVVFHAAAHKHVPLMEKNPSEVIKNNIIGTYNVVSCAHEHGVEKFVLISTDKAVNPTNIYGASKRFCEKIVQAFSNFSESEFAIVRFGNVLGSNGSIIQVFKEQIASGGPVTLTHPDIIRYYMTIPEASQLVLQAGAFATGGEIFVLDMGEPVKIYDLIVDMIRLSGLTPEKDIKIEIMGLRPGEKLYEELLMDNDNLTSTEHNKIFVEKPQEISFDYVDRAIDEFKNSLRKNNDEILFRLMEKYVESYERFESYDKNLEVAVDEEETL